MKKHKIKYRKESKQMKDKGKIKLNEKGITLVALIITIIILVILAVVSIMAVYRSKIVNYAINGTIDYATEAINENKVLEGTEKLIESAVDNINRIINAGIVNENIKLKTEKPLMKNIQKEQSM